MRTRVYVAGPYTAPTGDLTSRNVVAALDDGAWLLDLGYAPFVPHLTHWFDDHHPRDYATWMELDFAWVIAADVVFRRCDPAGFTLPSSGADRECELAESRGIPVVYGRQSFERWHAR